MQNEIKRLLKMMMVNSNGKVIVIHSDRDSSDWDTFLNFHGTDMLPDDFRYNTIKRLLESLVDWDVQSLSQLDQYRGDIVNELVDVYTANLTTWLASNVYRMEYCEAAKSENCSETCTFNDILFMGQYLEIDEILSNIVCHLESLENNHV